jgi:hypothetical protein
MACAGLALLSSFTTPAFATEGSAGGQNFVFIEESDRLPAYAKPAGTSTTDVDLVDVDRDGHLDLFFTQGTTALPAGPTAC